MNNDKILVEIASFCDKELLNTINSALIQADFPKRIYFAVCYQSDEIEDYEKLKQIKNCKVVWLKEKEAKGLCHARYLCQQMIDDEKYIYQIDSHMRFIKHWDTALIKELLSLNDPKAIISYYPQACTDEMLKLPLDDKLFDNPTFGGIMYSDEFREKDTPFVKVFCKTIDEKNPRVHTRNVFISGGNLFSFSEFHKEVFNDEKMFFYADELYMAIKLFTYGWNVYNSGVGYIYHQYNRKNSKFANSKDNTIEKENDRFIELINHKNDKSYLKKFDMGNVRTIEEFEKFSGIDFKKRIIYLNAETGEIDNKKYIGKLSFFKKEELKKEKQLNKKDIIEVLIVDIDGEYKKCIKNCLGNATFKERIKFIVGTTKMDDLSSDDILNMHIKNIITFDKKTIYSEILNKISKMVGNNYIAVTDSSVRFLYGWDKYLCNNIKNCGNKAALTSWLWNKNGDNTILLPYENITMKIQSYDSYLPVYCFDDSINFSNLNHPYHGAFLFNGFLFCHSKILKKIEVDPNLSYEEQKYLYALRLWTNGIDLYIPTTSYLYRDKDEKYLNTDNCHSNIVCALSRIKDCYLEPIENDYPYDIGNERPLWSWYEYININYDIENKKIIDNNTDNNS